MTRTFTRRDCVAPTRRTSPLCSTRSRLAWNAGLVEASSSRNRVPPSAASNRPPRSPAAPVNAPRVWPKSSASSSVSVRPEQFTLRKGRARRAAEIVDGARHQFLAGAGFAHDEHGGVGPRRLRDQLVHHRSWGRCGPPGRRASTGFPSASPAGEGVGLAARIQVAAQQFHHRGDIERLADEIAGAAAAPPPPPLRSDPCAVISTMGRFGSAARSASTSSRPPPSGM